MVAGGVGVVDGEDAGVAGKGGEVGGGQAAGGAAEGGDIEGQRWAGCRGCGGLQGEDAVENAFGVESPWAGATPPTRPLRTLLGSLYSEYGF